MRTLYRVALALVPSLLGSCRSTAPAWSQPDLAYEIRAPLPDDPCVRLVLRARADIDGNCDLEQKGSWGGTDDSSADLKELRALGADGRELPLEARGGGKWGLRAKPLEPLEVRWAIPRNTLLVEGKHQDHYRAALDEERFHAIGNHLWIAPAALSSDQPVRIALDWRGFEELGWSCASSFGTGPHQQLERTLDEFRQAVFLAGEYAFLERSIRGGRLVVALPEQGLVVEREPFADLVARVVEAQRAFFDDWDYPFYLVSAVATGKEDPHSHTLAGTGLTDSFALFLQRGTQLDAGAPRFENVLHVLAHEMFHNWCGHQTPMREPEQLCYWFSEGFTEFFTRRMLLRAGLSTPEQYARDLQQSLRDYAGNPRRNCTNEEIRAGFWKERELGLMPYRRGDLVAARLDGAIRAKSGGKKSLDDFLREAVALGRQREPIDVETLLARIERWTDAALARELRAVIVEGATLELPPDCFAPCLAIGEESVPAYELGFDFEATRKANQITGLVPGSAAEKAGLAEGQELMGFLGEQRSDRPVTVIVMADGARKDVQYLPQGPGVRLPSVKLVPGADCSAL